MTPVITLYQRPGCHLCEQARAAIVPLAEDLGLVLEEVDIDGDERLLRTYLERIPVVAIDGCVVSELELDEAALRERVHTVGP